MNRRRPQKRNQLDGFTLIEALIAITIGALIMATAYASFSVGIKTRNRVESNVRYLQDRRELMQFISREVRSMISYAPEYFHGESKTLRVRTYVPRNLAAVVDGGAGDRFGKELADISPVVDVEYEVITQHNAVLVIRRVRNLNDVVLEERPFDLGASDVKFGYTAADGTGDSWEDKWDREGEFPLAVRLSVDPFASGISEAPEHMKTRIITLPKPRERSIR